MSANLMNEPTEQMLIEEYLNDQGYTSKKLQELPQRVVKQLMREATRYAASKMEELKRNPQEGALYHN